jgi:hypothetical protein
MYRIMPHYVSKVKVLGNAGPFCLRLALQTKDSLDAYRVRIVLPYGKKAIGFTSQGQPVVDKNDKTKCKQTYELGVPSRFAGIDT